LGRMDLMHGQEIVRAALEGGGGAAAILAHIVRLIARAVAAIERRIEPAADAAPASEEAMLHAGEVGKRVGSDHALSEKPVGVALVSSPMASTRNRVPI